MYLLCPVSTEQMLPINEGFYRVCDEDTLRSGTFAIIRTKCNHGKEIHFQFILTMEYLRVSANLNINKAVGRTMHPIFNRKKFDSGY